MGDSVRISMSWEEAEEIYEQMARQTQKGAALAFVHVLGERLKERPKA
jgi:hypothetical protein